MFNAKNPGIEKIAKQRGYDAIRQLEALMAGTVNGYIDYANVRPWSTRLGWHVDLKRLKKFLDSFDNINAVKFYYGILKGDKDSEERIEDAKKLAACRTLLLTYDIMTAVSPFQKRGIKGDFIKDTLLDYFKTI